MPGRAVAASLDADRYRLVSPGSGPFRSTLVVLDTGAGATERLHDRLLEAGIDAAVLALLSRITELAA